ncbi:MAG: hypothetical protein RR382_08140 [Tannerellaceae bacterium]
MDLEEMKAGWSILNERLAENEILNKRIIKDMIKKRGETAIGKLYWYDLFGSLTILIVWVILCSVSFFIPAKGGANHHIMIIAFMLLPFGIWQLVKVNLLRKVDFRTNGLQRTVALIERYKRWVYKETFVSVFFAVFVMVYVFLTTRGTTTLTLFAIGIGLVVGTFITILEHYFYKNNIRKSQQVLDELKEFEEE